jgi:hypothetical protein
MLKEFIKLSINIASMEPIIFISDSAITELRRYIHRNSIVSSFPAKKIKNSTFFSIYPTPWVSTTVGRAVAQRLVAGFPPRRPGFEPEPGQVRFVVDKVALG